MSVTTQKIFLKKFVFTLQKISHFSILSSQLTYKTSYDDVRKSFSLVVYQSLDQSEAPIHLGSSKMMITKNNPTIPLVLEF